jgi:hypothetical protein
VAAAHQRRGRRRLRGRPGRDRLVRAAEEVRESEANLVDLFCVAEDGSTEATASGEAMAAAGTTKEEERNDGGARAL